MRRYVAIAALGFSALVTAAETVKPGLWEFKWKISDLPSAGAAIKYCISHDIAAQNLTPDLMFPPDCVIKTHDRRDGKYRVEVECSGSTGKQTLVINGEFLDANTISSTTDAKGLVDGREVTRRHESRGRWVSGDCGDTKPYGTASKPVPPERPYPDRAMAVLPKDYPTAKSVWQTNESARYEKLLTQGQADVLVVPFQVQEYAFDRPTRSLMTAHLALALTNLGGASVADPYLVSRALGEGRRRLERGDVYRLADKLKAKRIIWGHVGHDRKGSMALTVQFQDRTPDRVLDEVGKISKKDFENLMFSDEKPAIEVFQALLPEVLNSLGNRATTPGRSRPETEFDTSVFPESPIAPTNHEPEPARDAYYFQILGALTPRSAERTRERFFEKSLLAISQMSPRSSQYRALKARAYMHLGLRPAAVAALGKPSTLEEKALQVTLNGDLPALTKMVGQIKSPVIALFAKLDLNEMRYHYDLESQRVSRQELETLDTSRPAWFYLKERAFMDWDVWTQYDNFLLKKELDREFPIAGFDIEAILRGSVALGKTSEIETQIALSAARHVDRLFELRAEKWCCRDFSFAASEQDYVDLLEGIGTANLIRKANFYTRTQGSYNNTLEFLDRIEPVYKDHPAFMLARAEPQAKLAASADKNAHDVLLRSARENSLRAYHWEQAATRVAADAVKLSESIPLGWFPHPYAKDFPPRVSYPKWDFLLQDGATSHEEMQRQARKTFDTVLKYSLFDFRTVWSKFPSSGNEAETDASLALLNSRFAGNPMRALFLAEKSSRKGGPQAQERSYRSVISAHPAYWPAYERLGTMLVHEGKYAEAAKLYLEFPPFKTKKPDGPVAISNYAYDAGSLLYWRGAIDEAVPLYKVAADLRTGSHASLTSEVRLALLDGDYARATSISLERANRYHSTYAYRDYLGLLHLLGYSKEAWDAFSQVVKLFPKSPHVWETVLVGHRLEGRSESQIVAWAKRNRVHPGVDSADFAARYLVRAGVTDRVPSKELTTSVGEIEGEIVQVDLPAHPPMPVPPQEAGVRRVHKFVGRKSTLPPHQSELPSKVVKSDLVYFLEAYSALGRRDFASAAQTLREASTIYDMSSQYKYMLPYFALASARVGDVVEIEKILDNLSGSHDLDHYLARAALAGTKGRKDEALKSLRNAINRRPFTESRLLLVEYQIAEMGEWLSELTGHPEFRDFTVDWAKKNQRLQPWHAWAYAIEAKLTTKPSDRRRALGAALFLDKGSERLKGLTKEERDSAVKDFEKNNLFKLADDIASKTKT